MSWTPNSHRPGNQPLNGGCDRPSSTGIVFIQHDRPAPGAIQEPSLSQPTSPGVDLAATAHQPAPTAVRRFVNVAPSGSTPTTGYEPKGLEPCSVERLMRPIGRAIDMRKGRDIAVTTTATWPRGQNIPRDPPAAVTSCSCDHILGVKKPVMDTPVQDLLLSTEALEEQRHR